MENSKHTPGPWKTIELDGRLYINPYRDSEEYALIAKITGYIGSSGKRQEHKQANARLIAAAPEMLGLLEEAVKACRCNIGQDAPCWACRTRALLAKIEGA